MKGSNQNVLGPTLTGSNWSFFESPVCTVFSKKRKVTSLFSRSGIEEKNSCSTTGVEPMTIRLLPWIVCRSELQTNGGSATNKGSAPPVSLNEKYPSHVFNRLKIHHHIYIADQKKNTFLLNVVIVLCSLFQRDESSNA